MTHFSPWATGSFSVQVDLGGRAASKAVPCVDLISEEIGHNRV